ncbi:MAG: 16S rRNA (guanine(527)-N(7))-methyltransferase RsmG, partial [Eubacterium sp.]|nr:16S rRNA (guanine(527)-N(7))-methyltransferase RsmG [Eubacterium sp.]
MGLLEEILKKLNISIDENQKSKFKEYYSLLLEKNKVMNLTRITDEEEIIIKHFADSLTIAKIVEMDQVESLIDVGTGAGFPGIPIKIIWPEIKVTLLDSLDKRVGFLKEVIEELGLEGIEALHGRAEDFG